MDQPKYKRVLLKISGEALAGDASRGLDFQVIGQVCDVVKRCVELGVQVGVVVGGGNFWRGVKDGGDAMERVRADHMGMLATAINALAVADVLEQKGVEVRVQTAIAMQAVAEPYIRSKAIRHLEKGRVVIFGCGTGNPFFSTDTAAVLRAAEINADASSINTCRYFSPAAILASASIIASAKAFTIVLRPEPSAPINATFCRPLLEKTVIIFSTISLCVAKFT